MTRATIKGHTIAVDIDDVIAAQIPNFIRHSNQEFGTNITEETYTVDWPTLWGIPLEEAILRARKFHDDEISNFEKVEEAEPVLKRLAENYKLVIVTARAAYNIEATHAWINKHFHGVFSETHFVPIWEPNNTVTKADICRQIGADYLIDDQPIHCNIAAQAGIQPLLFGGYEWAKHHDLHEMVEVVDNWRKVEAYFHG